MISKQHWEDKIVLDTSVILYDALVLNTFKSKDIHIPLCVIEEIDRFKRDMGENGRNARRFSRFIDKLRQKGPLTEGVPIDSGSFVYINMSATSALSEDFLGLDHKKTDNHILGTALLLKRQFPKSKVELISKDINLRVKSDVFGVSSRDYAPDRVASADEMYTGVQNLEASLNQLEFFFKNHFLNIVLNYEDQKIKSSSKDTLVIKNKIYANQYVVIKTKDKIAFARYSQKQNKLVALVQPEAPIWRVHPRSPEQSFAFDALLNDEILLVSLLGKAGTGKTLLALAAGLHKTMDEAYYQRLLVSRPIFPMGRDIGYLPGDIEQKLNPWMQPIFDSLEFIMGVGKKAHNKMQELIDQGLLNIEPLAYIRGRSIPRQYMIVDESQNLTPHEIKTIITRAGLGTKIILTGDCYQIDNPYVDSSNSGLSYCIEKFKDEEISAHITLKRGERSQLAELAANKL